MGKFMPGTNGTYYRVQNESDIDLRKPGWKFQDDSVVKIWLYGNWWAERPRMVPSQLMGLGVRLGNSPNIEDGEGNNLNNEGGYRNIRFHGSQIRMKTDDSECKTTLSMMYEYC